MQDNTLLNIALSVSMIGIITLLLLSYYDQIPEKNFNEITSQDTGSRVSVNGIITQVYMHNNSVTFKLKQECLMDVYMFSDVNSTNKININIGKNISVTGTAEEYNGRMEIMAEKILSK